MNEKTSSKILATLSYATWGIVGFILLILRKADERFLKFHVYQSLLLGLIFLLLNFALDEILSLLGALLFFSKSVQDGFMLAGAWLMKILSLAQVGLLIYCMITLWRNKYTWVKWISVQIYRML